MGLLAPVATAGVCCGGGVVECTVVGPGALAAAKKGSRGKITEARIVSKGTHARNDSRHLDGIPFNGFATARHHARNPSKMASSSLFAVLASCCVIALSAGRSVEVVDVANASSDAAAACPAHCPCCTPKIDEKASVIEEYKKHRAHAAMIGDYGDCPVQNTGYTWDVNWGDGDKYKKHVDPMGPYQTTHTYAKKGKNKVTVKFCSHKVGAEYADCEDQCSTFSEYIHVKP